jgi:transposase-like protein
VTEPVLNLSATPLAPVNRWTPSRKDELLVAIRRADVTIEQVCEAHDFSLDEVQGWLRRHRQHGRNGLSVTKLQRLRA